MKRTILDELRNHFLVSISMFEKIIEICPNELWNKKEAGFIFWQQILHTIYWGHFWLRGEKDDFSNPFKEKNVYPNFEKEPEIILSKEEIKGYLFELKDVIEKRFSSKDDDWLEKIFFEKSPDKKLDKATNYDIIMSQIKHFDYHIGYCESIFRINNIDPKEYLEYYGDGIVYF